MILFQNMNVCLAFFHTPFSNVILKFVVSHSHTPKPSSSREVITVTKSVYIPLELFSVNFQIYICIHREYAVFFCDLFVWHKWYHIVHTIL